VSDSETPPPYKVIYSEPAEAQVDAAYEWLQNRSYDVANQWLDGLAIALNRVAAQRAAVPGIRDLAPSEDQRPNRALYIYRYRATRGGAVWKILYELVDADEDGAVDTLQVVQVRHASMRPLDSGKTEDDDE
jgi:plasmid stabilization system protein ParE